MECRPLPSFPPVPQPAIEAAHITRETCKTSYFRSALPLAHDWPMSFRTSVATPTDKLHHQSGMTSPVSVHSTSVHSGSGSQRLVTAEAETTMLISCESSFWQALGIPSCQCAEVGISGSPHAVADGPSPRVKIPLPWSSKMCMGNVYGG